MIEKATLRNLVHGDMREVLATLRENSIDACVTDPPYHLTSIVQRFRDTSIHDANGTGQHARDRSTPHARLSRGFMGKQWDGGTVAFEAATWAAVYRVLKPGSHMLVFGGTRTSHRVVCAIEDAGFEVRDTLCWLYGSGFPKSHNISRMIDKEAGVKGKLGDFKTLAHERTKGWKRDSRHEGWARPWMDDADATERGKRNYIAATPEAAYWEGWGSGLKPAYEPIVLVRKPISERTLAANVLKHSTGALNIDACRVEGKMDGTWGTSNATVKRGRMFNASPKMDEYRSAAHQNGRWPANVAHDGSDEVAAAFAVAGERVGAVSNGRKGVAGLYNDGIGDAPQAASYGDTGTASRFFYSAKADKSDRAGSNHPTIKPLSLVRWLVRMITPDGGTVLDPFAGSGTTLQAARVEGFQSIGIELEDEYFGDMKKRMRPVLWRWM